MAFGERRFLVALKFLLFLSTIYKLTDYLLKLFAYRHRWKITNGEFVTFTRNLLGNLRGKKIARIAGLLFHENAMASLCTHCAWLASHAFTNSDPDLANARPPAPAAPH